MAANHCVPHTDAAKAKISASKKGRPATWKHRQSREEDGVTLYRCGRCAGFFQKEGFYANKRTLLGIKSECRACHTATCIKSRNPDTARVNNAAYMARARSADPAKFQEREREASRNRVKDEKVAARKEINKALKRGDLTKPAACESCGLAKKLSGHHDDYAQPLVVRWLCYGCHGKEHRQVIEDRSDNAFHDAFPEARS